MTKISIIIPTHNRSHVLKRSIEYYSSFKNCEIIICDSSCLKDEFASIQKDINYHHCPNMLFASKILFGINKSTTEFVCLSADDDFLSSSGLKSGYQFLYINTDYVSVQGMYTQFTYIGKGRVVFNKLYDICVSEQLRSDIPEDRVQFSMQPYIQQLYSLHRKVALKKAMELASTVPRVTNVEIACNLVPMIFGKHKILDEFWMARDSRRYTTYNLSGNNHNTVIDNYHNYFKTKEGKNFITNYGILFSTTTKTSDSKGEEVFNSAFQKYLIGVEKKHKKLLMKPSIVKSFFRKLLPESILYLRRKRLMDKLSFGNSNISEAFEWLKMKKVIIKYGFLDEQTDIRL